VMKSDSSLVLALLGMLCWILDFVAFCKNHLAFGVAIPRRAVMSDRAWIILFTSFSCARFHLCSAQQSGPF
jgi:hypothetical protein